MPTPNQPRRLRFKILLLVVSLAIALGVAECADRLFMSEANDTFIVPIKRIDERYHHPLEIPPLPAPRDDAVRILFLGDSFTWGWGVKDRTTQAFPPLVETYFNERSGSGAAAGPVQSFNLGMVSYSPSIYGIVLRDYAPILKPDIVVLALDDSDPHDDLVYSTLLKIDGDGLPLSVYPGMPGVPHALIPIAKRIKLVRHASWLFGKIANRVSRARGNTGAITDKENRYGHYRPGPGSDEQWADMFAHSLGLVDACRRYCVAHGISLVIVNYPYPPAVTTRYSPKWGNIEYTLRPGMILEPTFHKACRDFAAERHLPYYNLTPRVRAVAEPETLYTDDGHFSAPGYDLLARELVTFLAPMVEDVLATRRAASTPKASGD